MRTPLLPAACLLTLTAGAGARTDPALLVLEASFSGTQSAGVSGDTLALVQPSGDVHVHLYDGNAWSLEAVLSPQAGDPLFRSVALDGDVLAAGHDASGGTGLLSVFERTGTTWSPALQVALGSAGAEDVDVLDDRVAVATGADVLVYSRASGAWVQEAAVAAPAAPGRVALAEDRVFFRVVHAPSAHRIEAYRWTGSAWVLEQSLPSPTAPSFNEMGWGLDATRDGARLAAGDYNWSYVLVFARSGTSWSLEAQLDDPSGFFTESFGEAVAIEGDQAWISAWTDDVLYAFERTAGGWSLQGSLDPPGPPGLPSFGQRLASDAARVVVSDTGVQHVYAVVDPPQAYCTPKITSGGCLAAVDGAGLPSATAAGPFLVTARDVTNNKNGLFFYGTSGPAAIPFLGGTLCAQPPLQRTPVQSSGGNPPPDDCSGGFLFDGNGWIQSGVDPALAAGAEIHGQFWFRDPGDPFGAALSDGLAFTVLD